MTALHTDLAQRMVDEPGADAEGARSARGAAAKVLDVLQAFAGHDEFASLTELANRSSLPKSTTHRMLRFLREAGLVHGEDGRYQLGAQVAALASALPPYLPRQTREILLACLTDLYEATHEAVQLSVLRDGGALVVERVHGRRSADLVAWMGTVLPLHGTAPGKVLLAAHEEALLGEPALPLPQLTSATETDPVALSGQLADVRRTGLALDKGEWHPMLAGIAVPVRGAGRSVLAALSVMGPTIRFRPEDALPHLRRIAHIASRDLARRTGPGRETGQRHAPVRPSPECQSVR